GEYVFFFSSRRRHTRFSRDWSSDVCSSDLVLTTENRRSQWRGYSLIKHEEQHRRCLYTPVSGYRILPYAYRRGTAEDLGEWVFQKVGTRQDNITATNS